MEQKKDLILKVSGVTKRFPGVLQLNKVSFGNSQWRGVMELLEKMEQENLH